MERAKLLLDAILIPQFQAFVTGETTNQKKLSQSFLFVNFFQFPKNVLVLAKFSSGFLAICPRLTPRYLQTIWFEGCNWIDYRRDEISFNKIWFVFFFCLHTLPGAFIFKWNACFVLILFCYCSHFETGLIVAKLFSR